MNTHFDASGLLEEKSGTSFSVQPELRWRTAIFRIKVNWCYNYSTYDALKPNIIFYFLLWAVKDIIRLDRSSPNAIGPINSQQNDSKGLCGLRPLPLCPYSRMRMTESDSE